MEGETWCSGSRLSDNVTTACICVETKWKWVSLKKKKKKKIFFFFFFLGRLPLLPWSHLGHIELYQLRASDFFKIGGPKWPMKQKKVGHFLKWWAQAYLTKHSWHLDSLLYLHTDTDTCMHMYIDCWLYSKTCLKQPLKKKRRPIIAYSKSKVLQNAPLGAFCNPFDLH